MFMLSFIVLQDRSGGWVDEWGGGWVDWRVGGWLDMLAVIMPLVTQPDQLKLSC